LTHDSLQSANKDQQESRGREAAHTMPLQSLRRIEIYSSIARFSL